jgi:RNA polymerase sigma factor (sigma-70 family)
MKNNQDSEGAYPSFLMLLGEVLNDGKPVDVLLEHAECERRLKRICYGLAGNRDGAEDLYQEACRKFLQYRDAISRRNTGNPEEFFGYLYTMVLHLRLDQVRLENRIQYDETPVEELEPKDLLADLKYLDHQCLLSELHRFSKTLPKEYARAIELYEQGYTFREIAETLRSENYQCSHVTVRTWIKDALKNFGSHGSIRKVSGF